MKQIAWRESMGPPDERLNFDEHIQFTSFRTNCHCKAKHAPHPAGACPERSRRSHPLPAYAGRGATVRAPRLVALLTAQRGEGGRRPDEGHSRTQGPL